MDSLRYIISIIVPPGDFYLISSKTLCNRALRVPGRERFLAGPVSFQSSTSDHGSIINAETLVRSTQFRTSFFRHLPEHLLEPEIAANPAHGHNAFAACMTHNTFCCLYKHRKDSFLERIRKLLNRWWGVHLFHQRFNR